jgi:hypothetical protein
MINFQGPLTQFQAKIVSELMKCMPTSEMWQEKKSQNKNGLHDKINCKSVLNVRVLLLPKRGQIQTKTKYGSHSSTYRYKQQKQFFIKLYILTHDKN